MSKPNIIQRITGFFSSPKVATTEKLEDDVTSRLNPVTKATTQAPIPKAGGRISAPNQQLNEIVAGLNSQYDFVTTEFTREVIPLIRKLVKANPNFGQALQNVVFLGNTGHKINFDKNLKPEEIEKMRNHIQNRYADWASGLAGMDGLVNRLFSQVMIGGAISAEWVPKDDLSGIEAVVLVNPEDIYFRINNKGTKYKPYQKNPNPFAKGFAKPENYIPLPEITYRYYALNGDTEIPYGYPPYLAAMEPFELQQDMNTNIKHVVNLMGFLGFMGVQIEQPDPRPDESDEAYLARLDTLLFQAKTQLDEGFKNGTVVGFKDKWEMDYHTFSKDIGQAIDLWKQNELQFFSGLKHDASLAGRDYGSSESQITVIFMKLLSELKNIQQMVKRMLEFGYNLELRMAGFKFQYLEVEFNRSTIQDDLKFQQALEYKIKNYKELYLMGTIDEYEFANVMGYEAPKEDEPRIPVEMLAGGSKANPLDAAGTPEDRDKAQKNRSAKKQRSKDKPQGAKK